MNKKHIEESLHVDLWPSGAWTDNDLKELMSSLHEFGPVAGERTSEPRGAGLQITLAFITAAIFTGFLEKIGEDLYEALRAKIKKVLKVEPTQQEAAKRADFLSIYGPGPFSGVEVGYVCEYYREDDLNIFFMTVGNLHSLLLDPNRNGLDAFPKGTITAHLCTKDGLQHFAQMRVDWFLRGENKPRDFPSPPYWMLDTSVKANDRWHEYVAVVPARVSRQAYSSSRRIEWKERELRG